jgi:hypothetical protein
MATLLDREDVPDHTKAKVWKLQRMWGVYVWEKNGDAYWAPQTFFTQAEAFTAAFKKVRKIRKKRG